MSKRQLGAWSSLTLALLLVAGCGSQKPSPTPAPTRRAAPRVSDATAAPTRPAAPRASGATAVYQRPKSWYRKGLRTPGFQSPTGNIRCALETYDNTQLLCMTLNNGNAVDLGKFLDVDTNLTATIPAEPTLPYGQAWSSGNFYCWSRFTGVTCRSLYSSHGFEIDRDGISSYIWNAPVLTAGGNLGSSLGIGGGANLGSGSETQGDFCTTHSCIGDWTNPSGYIVQCADGTWSHSGGVSGACSWHGGER
jgi:hypothetical protein